MSFISNEVIFCSVSTDSVPPPVQNWTVITLYLQELTWNDATQVCEEQGGKILDITYYSIFDAMITLAAHPPWSDLPIAYVLLCLLPIICPKKMLFKCPVIF